MFLRFLVFFPQKLDVCFWIVCTGEAGAGSSAEAGEHSSGHVGREQDGTRPSSAVLHRQLAPEDFLYNITITMCSSSCGPDIHVYIFNIYI